MQNLLIKPSVALVQPSGHINAANSLELQAHLNQVISDPNHAVVLVDMSQVDSLDSAGLMALTAAMTAAQQSGIGFNLCCVPPAIRIIFEVTQLDRVFQIFESRADFDASLS
jgi:anti-anti-sigma factor